jgi:parallel beta-helix repeat protein
MVAVRPFFFKALRRLLLVSALAFAVFSARSAPVVDSTPSPILTPLHLNEIAPRTESVDLEQFYHVRYVIPETNGAYPATGEPGAPWTSLADALSAITDAGPRNRYVLLVAAGVYTVKSLALKPWVEVYGGYDPKGWTRDIDRNPTVLDGGQAGPILVGADNSRIDGFIIRNARSDQPGGAILCEETSPLISNNTFTTNSTLPVPDNPYGIPGGAIACLGRKAHPTIERNVFAFNSTLDGDGGAIACLDGADAVIRFNVFTGNISGLGHLLPAATSCGGAIACVSGASAEIFSNLFVNNLAGDASDGGAIFALGAGAISLRRNILAGNDAEGSGGGVMFDEVRDFTVSANTITSNMASDAGGGLCFETGCRGTLENNAISENKASSGGGIAANGSALALNNNTICANMGDRGSGMLAANTQEVRQAIRIVNCIIYDNDPTPDLFVSDEATSLTVMYSDIEDAWDGPRNMTIRPRLSNDQLTGQAAIMDYNPVLFQTRLVLVTRQFVKPDLLQGRVIRIGTKRSVIVRNRQGSELDRQEIWVWGDITGGGMNRAPASFAVLPTYRLLPDSPCIDTGANLGPDLDLYGNSRPIQGYDALATDIGAVEFIPLQPKINPNIPRLPPSDP